MSVRKVVPRIARCLSKLIGKDNNRITIIYRGFSGSNLTPIIEALNEEEYDYKITIINDFQSHSERSSSNGRLAKFKSVFKKYWSVFRSKLVITTHGFYRLRSDTTMLNLWHGVPIKSMSLMHKTKNDAIGLIDDDYFLSTSPFFNTIMNACIGITVDKYYIAGYPRNDYLFKENGLTNLNYLLETKLQGKIVLYMPTYRSVDSRGETNKTLFGYPDFDMNRFRTFLSENDITFLVKLHPNDEQLILGNIPDNVNDRVILIKSDDLEKKKMDLYKIINAVDLLITDYSSIYFDFLLLDRPIIFTPMDLDEYRSNPGLLLEPYEFWTPGYKCLNQSDLQEKILLELRDGGSYGKERSVIKNIVHKYQDAYSTKRVLDLIHEIMSE